MRKRNNHPPSPQDFPTMPCAHCNGEGQEYRNHAAVGRTMRRWRISQGVGVRELATRLDCSPAYIVLLEQGAKWTVERVRWYVKGVGHVTMSYYRFSTIWRGRRYWKQDDFVGRERRGWNTCFEPYRVTRVTAKRVTLRCDHLNDTVQIDRAKLETGERVYHTKHHEYFYTTKPKSDPEHRIAFHAPAVQQALALLGLVPPCTETQIKQAYKRLSLSAHPDTGGSHELFIELGRAYETALRTVAPESLSA